MTKRITSKAVKLLSIALVALMLLGFSVIGVSAAATPVSTYTCDFEGNYYSNLSGNTCTEGAIDGGALKFSVNSDSEKHRFEIYNSKSGDLKLKDGSMYSVTIKYKVESISASKESEQPTQIFLVRYDGSDNLIKLKALGGATYLPGDTTDWVTQTVVFKAAIGDSVAFNRLAVSVFSPSCPATPTSVEKNKTVISFDDIVVNEYPGNCNAIEFQTNGGEHVGVIMGSAGEAITLPSSTRKYYDFAGWYTDSALKTPFTGKTMPSRTTTRLYAKWTVSESAIKVDFNARGVENPEFFVGDPGNPITLPTVSRDGFRFAGWYNKELTTRMDLTAIPKESTTLYAKWELIPQFCGYENADVFSQPNNGTFTKRCKLSTDDKFSGTTSLFYDNDLGTSGNPSALAGVQIMDDRGIQVKMTPGMQYVIEFKYKVIRADGIDGAVGIASGAVGGAWTNRIEILKFKDGFSFGAKDVGKGWKSGSITFTASDDAVSCYPYFSIGFDGQVYFDDLVFYPKTDVAAYNGYMINFDSQGGSYVETLYGKAGDTVTLPAEPTREGYKFLGWCLDAECNNPYSETTFTHSYTTLYADWFKEWVAPEESETPPESETPVEGEPEDDPDYTLYIIIGIAAAVVIAVVVVVIVVIAKKKKKTPEITKTEETAEEPTEETKE